MKLTLVGWIFNGQNQHCKNIEQRHAAEHHKRSHTGSAIDILDEGYAKDCCTASVTGLHEFTGQAFITQENACQNPDDDDGNGGGSETEQDEFAIEIFRQVNGCHITEQHGRKSDTKNQLICHGTEFFWQKLFLPEHISYDNHDKDRKRGIQAENQITHM